MYAIFVAELCAKLEKLPKPKRKTPVTKEEEEKKGLNQEDQKEEWIRGFVFCWSLLGIGFEDLDPKKIFVLTTMD